MRTSPTDPAIADLRRRLADVGLADERRLRRRLDEVRRARDPRARRDLVAAVREQFDEAEQRLVRRREGLPKIGYPAELPVSQRKDDIAEAIRDHQVVIIAGETGSGKTTQIPKICLELGRGIRGMIGHTQPRRIAARATAERIAEELDTELGDVIGYQVRFTDRSSPDTLVKVMTDGILLTELQRDRLLRHYDTLIIDEAHERSLNIDFILGYLKQILPRRPDLKLIITSATIDPERFSRHFGEAPILEVSGRTYPVEVRYRPLADPEQPSSEDHDQIQGILDAVDELTAEGRGDVLVFLSGEREIRDTADALRRQQRPNTEILPLYARLSAAEQHRVFRPHPGRRIVLATNVAETSLTVPGIKYVVDPGTARISRYSQRLKVQRLPIEPISQASANQRTGRCGRVSEGICIRLYSEDDFESRPEFTDPEVQRTNLASVILQMASLGLGDVEGFPFIDPPDRRQIADGVRLLEELGALESTTRGGRGVVGAQAPAAMDVRHRLTPIGRRLAQLPVDPRLGRMVLEADRNGCLREVLVIVSALSIQDPRERPADNQQAADQMHARFVDNSSDFLTYLNLWNHIREQQRTLSSSQFRKMCKTEFLHYLRVREWQDLYAQLRQIARNVGLTLNATPADPGRIHISLLTGLLSHIGLKDPERGDYLGARGARIAIFPGSGLFKKSPRWVMAAELVETARLWARIAARIEPEWIEPLAGHLVQRTYSEPHWDRQRGAVMALEKVTLYGVPIVVDRPVTYGRIDPALARELFIRHALVYNEWDTRHRFFHHNRTLLAEVAALEDRVRRRDILVDEQTLFDFYDKRVSPGVVSARHFDSWWKKARRDNPDLLTFDRAMLVNPESAEVREADFPDEWRQGDLRFRLTYQFEPGTAADGVTVHIPLQVLNQVGTEQFEWQVPGLREELVTALIRSLPKAVRRSFVPAPNYAKAVLDGLTPGEGSLLDAVARELHRMGGPLITRDEWQLNRVPDYLRMTFRVVEKRRVAGEGRDLEELKQRLAPKLRDVMASASSIERGGLTTWDFGDVPALFEETRNRMVVKGYPTLVDEGASVAIRILGTAEEQRSSMWAGTRRLLLLTIPSPVKGILGRLDNRTKLALTHAPHARPADLLDDCISCAADALTTEAGGPVWSQEGFARLRDHVRGGLHDTVLDVVREVAGILALAHEVSGRLSGTGNPALLPALTDMRRQMERLVYPGFVTATGRRRLPDVLRYLRGIQRRLDKLPSTVARDRVLTEQVEQVQAEYDHVVDLLPPARRTEPAVLDVRWMIEELRVSYFAQALKTPYPISDKRIYRSLDQILER